MKRKFPNIAALTVAAIFVLGGCGNGNNSNNEPHPFPKATPPAMLGEGRQALSYIARNYWNRFIDSSKVYSQDTSLIGGVTKEDFMNACQEYVTILSNIPLKEGIAAQTNFASRLVSLERENPENTLFDLSVEFNEEVIYGVNSDYRNEELYLPVATILSQAEFLDSTLRKKYAEQARMCSLNRIGTQAADFKYTHKSGKVSSLYNTPGEYTVIFFSNPGCTSCKEIIDVMSHSPIIGYMIEQGRLKVINIYIDEDLAQWYKYMPIYPKEWINVYNADLQIKNTPLYDIRAIPTLYLLDKEKRVILKDAPLQILLNALNNTN